MTAPMTESRPLRAFARSLPMTLLRAREAVMSRFRPLLRAHGLSDQQWRVLRALDADGPQRASDLSVATLLSGPSLSRLLPGLESRRLLRRRAHPEDQRATRISITPEGSRLVATIAPASEAIYAEIAAAVGETSLETLYRLLDETTERIGPGSCPDVGASAPDAPRRRLRK